MLDREQWYYPQYRTDITSKRMVSEIVNMNKQHFPAALRYLSDGTMLWIITLPTDETCDTLWKVLLLYDKKFSKPGCEEPFHIEFAKPTLAELTAAAEKGGCRIEDLRVPVNGDKNDLTAVEAVSNIINWRKKIYPSLSFSSKEDDVVKQSEVQKDATSNSAQNVILAPDKTASDLSDEQVPAVERREQLVWETLPVSDQTPGSVGEFSDEQVSAVDDETFIEPNTSDLSAES